MEHEQIQQSISQEFNELPINMTVEDVAKFLGVSPSTAYKLVKQDSFPKLRIPGRRLVIVPRHLFFTWYRACAGESVQPEPSHAHFTHAIPYQPRQD